MHDLDRITKRVSGLKKRYAKGKRYFPNVDLIKANLVGITLDKAELTRAKLTEANFSRASLIGTYLTKADLSHANLNGANLIKANLIGANLTAVELSNACLAEAYLNETNLSGANLSGVNLEGASLYRANLSGANLRGAYYNEKTYFDANFDPVSAGMQIRKIASKHSNHQENSKPEKFQGVFRNSNYQEDSTLEMSNLNLADIEALLEILVD
jgi:hypothetical protein